MRRPSGQSIVPVVVKPLVDSNKCLIKMSLFLHVLLKQMITIYIFDHAFLNDICVTLSYTKFRILNQSNLYVLNKKTALLHSLTSEIAKRKFLNSR